MARQAEMPKVWMICPSFYPVVGGEEVQVQWLAEALVKRGRSVQVLTRRHGRNQPPGLSKNDLVDDVVITRIYTAGPGMIGSILYILGAVWFLALHGRAGIYSAFDIGAAGWIAVIASYLLRGPSIIKMRSGRKGFEQRYVSGRTRWQFSMLLRLAGRITIVNRELKEYVKELGVSKEKVIHLPNGVNTEEFSPVSSEEKTAARLHLGIPLDKTVFLFVGRLERVKGLDVLFRAWSSLPKRKIADSLLVLVGDGAERQNLSRLSESLNIQEYILMAGKRSDVHGFYAAADIFAFPSRSEGMPLALMEAMASGLPVITSRVGGALDVVEDGRNGLLFESEHDVELARKLSFIFDNKHRWEDMGNIGRNSIVSLLDLKLILNRVEDLYWPLSGK